MAKLLVIDNYDSFTYNLIQMFMNYELYIDVYRSDMIDISSIHAHNPDYILLSPGPKEPAHAGISLELVKEFYRSLPILGVCLGMQCINEAFGGRTVRSPLPMHGKTSSIHHSGRGIFRDVPPDFIAARYHSLIVEPGSDELHVTATSDDIIMGISHSSYPLHGVQFHPESFLTEYGFQIIENFLSLGALRGEI